MVDTSVGEPSRGAAVGLGKRRRGEGEDVFSGHRDGGARGDAVAGPGL